MQESKLTRDFPSNSDKSKREMPKEAINKESKIPEIPKCKAIAKGNKTKKTFLSNFLGEGAKEVGSYIMNDVLIPAAKATLYDIITGGASMSLWGERRTGRSTYRSGDIGRSSLDYTRYSSNNDRRDLSRTARVKHEFDGVEFDSKPEAEEVLSALVDQTIEYGSATVANFYELSGIRADFTDRNYGWTNLRDAYTARSRNKYIIILPQARALD